VVLVEKLYRKETQRKTQSGTKKDSKPFILCLTGILRGFSGTAIPQSYSKIKHQVAQRKMENLLFCVFRVFFVVLVEKLYRNKSNTTKGQLHWQLPPHSSFITIRI